MKKRIGIYVGNPSQYHSPVFRALSNEMQFEITVLYGSSDGLYNSFNPEFHSYIKWDVDLLAGHRSYILPNYCLGPRGGFFSRLNIGLPWQIIRRRFDFFLIHGYGHASSWLALFTCRLFKVPVLFRGESLLKSPVNRRFEAKFGALAARFFLSQCDIVFFSCIGNRAAWVNLSVPEEKLFPFVCSVDNSFFLRQKNYYFAQREAMRSRYGIKESDLVVVTCSRMTNRKRLADLIEGVCGIDRFFLVFIGDGPERQRLEKLATSKGVRALFPGFINQSKLGEFFILADIFAMLSSYDASPKALNEAMNFDLAVVCSSGVGTAFDLIKDGVNGFVTEPGSIEQIKSIMRSFSELNSEALRSMGEESTNIVANFDVSCNVANLEKALCFLGDQVD